MLLSRPLSKALPPTPAKATPASGTQQLPSTGQGKDATNRAEDTNSSSGTIASDALGLHNMTPDRKEDASSSCSSSVDAPRSLSRSLSNGNIKNWSPRWAPKMKRNWPSPSSENILQAAEPKATLSSAPSLSLEPELFDQASLTDELLESVEGLGRGEDPREPAGMSDVKLGSAACGRLSVDPDKTPMPDLLTPKQRSESRMLSSASSTLTITPLQSNSSLSPALAGLISSFPSPVNRNAPVRASPVQMLGDDRRSPAAPRLDGHDELRTFEDRKHAGERFSPSDAASGPIFVPAGRHTSQDGAKDKRMQHHNALRLAPPGPAPERDLPARPRDSQGSALSDIGNLAVGSEQMSGSRSPLKRLTLEGGPPDSSAYQAARNPARVGQKAGPGHSRRASSSLERLSQVAVAGQRTSPYGNGDVARRKSRDLLDDLDRPSTATTLYASASSSAASSAVSLVLGPSASTGEIARSLDIPRDAIKQMLETTQHVWRNHSPIAATAGARASTDRLKRVKSSPDLLDADKFLSEALESTVDGIPTDPTAASPDGRRASLSTLPYLSSARQSSETQSPTWTGRGGDSQLLRRKGSRGLVAESDTAAEMKRNRRTYVGNQGAGGAAATNGGGSGRPNFSRPIRPSASDSSLKAAVLGAHSLLGSPVRLHARPSAGRRMLEDEDEEVLMDDDSEPGHAPVVGVAKDAGAASAPSFEQHARPITRSLDLNRLEALASMPHSPHRLERRNSDSGTTGFGVGRGKRQPGELHAWSVVIDETGFPSIRTAPSAFHHPACPLAGKGNATWQCGCRGFDHGPGARQSISVVPRFGAAPAATEQGRKLRAMVSTPDFGARARSSSMGNLLDDARQAALWQEVERHRAKISQHQAEIDQLQATVERMSMEMASTRPSLSLESYGPPRAPSAMGSNRSISLSQASGPLLANAAGRRGPPPSSFNPTYATLHGQDEYRPRVDATNLGHAQPAERTLRSHSSFTGSIRRRFSSLGRSQGEEAAVVAEMSNRQADVKNGSGRRLRASSSTSSINKLFGLPWSTKRNGSERHGQPAYPEPDPFPYQPQHSVREPTAPISLVRQDSGKILDNQRPLPSVPSQGSTSRHPTRKYPPSARKFSFDALSGRAEHSSVARRHSRDPSSSSRASSANNSASHSEGYEAPESRFAFFPRSMRRWDSLSSRATSVSERSLDRHHVVAEPKPVIPDMIHHIAALPPLSEPTAPLAPSRASQDSVSAVPSAPPPRRSSLRSKAEPPVPGPAASALARPSLQLSDVGMAPISELSEAGTPTSMNRRSMMSARLESSPSSLCADAGRMSMSERFVPHSLSIPTSLPPSSIKVSHSGMLSGGRGDGFHRHPMLLQTNKPLPSLDGTPRRIRPHGAF